MKCLKKYILIVVFCIGILLLTGCGIKRNVEVTGEVMTKSINVDKCEKLLIKNIYLTSNALAKVEIKPGSERKVVITAKESLVKEIDVKKSGDYLNITASKFSSYNTNELLIEIYGFTFSVLRLSTVDAFLDSSSLKEKLEIDVSGAGSATIDEFSGDIMELDISGASIFTANALNLSKIEASISGASRMDIDNLESTNSELEVSGASEFTSDVKCEDLNLEISGASNVILSGEVNTFDVELSGASNGSCKKLMASNVEVDLSGASNLSISFSGRLDGDLSGVSKLVYYGDKSKVKVDLSGGSSCNQGD